MKYLFLFTLAIFTFSCKQNPPCPELQPALPKISNQEGFETFEMKEGDTTYVMKKYYLCLLKKGSKRDQAKAEAEQLQKAHLAHLTQLAADKKICLVGPLDGENDIRGIAVYSTKTAAEADSLANADPAVKAGRLVVEIHPWWTAIGGTLF